MVVFDGIACWRQRAVAQEKIKAATTIGMVADLVKQVGGDRVEVDQLMGPGVDPHLYKPTSTDAGRLSKADVIFYSGLMLEGRMGDLFAKLARAGNKVYPTTESVPEDLLTEPKEFAGHYDPHIWFDVSMWAQTVPTIIKGLSEVDPAGKANLREERCGAYGPLGQASSMVQRHRRGAARKQPNPCDESRRLQLFRPRVRLQGHRLARRLNGVGSGAGRHGKFG